MSGDCEAALARWAQAADELVWSRRWTALFEPAGRSGRWFAGGEMNAAVNCVDRHLPGRGDRPAIHWEGEPGDRRTLTYAELDTEVRALAAALRRLGLGRGDRVALYMGWIPEAVVAVLACARIGAVSSLVPLSLPAEALADRLAAFRARVLVTQDGAWRHGLEVPLKERADEALATLTEPEGVGATVVVRRTGSPVDWFEGDHWYGDLVAEAAAAGGDDSALPVRADHPLLVQYLGGRRHQPLGVVLPTAGLLVSAAEIHRRVFSETEGDVLWAAMELSFINGIAQGVLGPLCAGSAAVMCEGMLDTPTWSRAWEIIECYRVSALFTTPSTVRQLRKATDGVPFHDLASLRLVVTGGERSEEEDSAWLAGLGGGDRGPLVVNAWGQTETGGAVFFSPFPQGPGSLPDPGLAIVDGSGVPVPAGGTGELVLRHPWPGLFVEVEGHPDVDGRYWRYAAPGAGVAAWSYATGDLARQDAAGEVEILRRLDPTVKVSGQLVSLADVSEVLAEHPLVEQAIAVQTLDAEGGRSMLGCVILTPEANPDQRVADDLCRHVHECLGGLARPANIAFLDEYPADASPAVLRQALALAGAGRTKSQSFVVGADQLREAIAATGPI